MAYGMVAVVQLDGIALGRYYGGKRSMLAAAGWVRT